MALGIVVVGGNMDPADYYDKTTADKKFLTGITKEQVVNALGYTPPKLDAIYPVGSIYMSTSSTSPASLFGGTWEEIASERVLMGRSSSHAAGTTVSAGLPNITGSFSDVYFGGTKSVSGALQSSYTSTNMQYRWNGNDSTWTFYFNRSGTLDASRSSSIYGKSSTVQPAAYYVYMWRRIK